MAREARRIDIPKGGEVARLLAAADAGPLLIEYEGDLYRLARVQTGQEDSVVDDPEGLRAAIVATRGSWADLDSEALIEAIHRAREAGSRPPGRP